MVSQTIVQYISGTHNVLDDENIPVDAASDSLNWVTIDGQIVLINGREIVGTEGLAGETNSEWFGYKNDGTKVHFRKAGTKIQTLVGSTWTDVITGLTATAKYSFTNYASLAGTFTFASGVDGIYKIHTAFPTTYNSMYDSTKNFKGRFIIDKARARMWDTTTDKTGLYGSYIDGQNSTVYTTVTGEATTSLTGTLAFKAGGATRNAFGVRIVLTGTGEVYTDNYLGVLTGSLGGTGTINYLTGAYTLSNAGVGTASYQWEDSNIKGVTDYTKSATRLAGEGYVVRQDEGGDAIQQVLVGPDGSYYSMKKQSVYRFTEESTDLNPTNEVFRKDIGIPGVYASVSAGRGIIFMNTANPDKPELTVLEKNPLGDNLQPTVLVPHYKFQNFVYDDDTVVDTWNRFVIVACKSSVLTQTNDRLILVNLSSNTAEATYYAVSCTAKDGSFLYAGSPLTLSTSKLFVDFDDDSSPIDNYWIGKGETYKGNNLKKFRRERLMGLISPSQNYSVYVSYDDADFALVGTVRGDGEYVDTANPQTVGSNLVGESDVGGDEVSVAFPYFIELKLKTPKFRKRTFKFVANEIGYVSINSQQDWDLMTFEERIPKRYRLKQNVSLDGTETGITPPEF